MNGLAIIKANQGPTITKYRFYLEVFLCNHKAARMESNGYVYEHALLFHIVLTEKNIRNRESGRILNAAAILDAILLGEYILNEFECVFSCFSCLLNMLQVHSIEYKNRSIRTYLRPIYIY